MKKPIYKKWWVWLIVVVFAIGIIGSGGEDESDQEDNSNNIENNNEVEENKPVDNDETTPIEEESTTKKIEVNQDFEINNVKISLQSITVEDEIITIPFRWQHWVSNDEVHFSVLAYVAVYQGDEHLELVSGEDSQYKKVKKGVDGFVELDYKLIDGGGPLEIKFIRTTDEAEEESITIDIN